MLISNYITPVMLTDSTGYVPKLIENVGDWFGKHIFEPISNWLDTIPEGKTSIGRESGILSFIGGWINGLSWTTAASKSLQSANKLGRVYGTFNKGLGIGLKSIGSFVSYSLLAFDIATVWDANNLNTNGERLLKTSLSILEFAFAVTIATAVGTMIVASTPVLVIVAVAVVGVTISYGMYRASDWLYQEIGVE